MIWNHIKTYPASDGGAETSLYQLGGGANLYQIVVKPRSGCGFTISTGSGMGHEANWIAKQISEGMLSLTPGKLQ